MCFPGHAPQVGIASVWYEGNPCNMHLLDVALAAKEEVQARNMVRRGASAPGNRGTTWTNCQISKDGP